MSAASRDRCLKARGLRKSYSGREVVRGVDLEVSSGRIIGLLGPNGAGKTTTFYMVTGLCRPDGGQVLLDDEELTLFPMHQRARKGISYLPQEPSIFRKLTVRQNILAVLEMMDISRSRQHERAAELLGDLGITHISSSPGFALSGGERRRVEIARALATDPAFILLDEPFAGIDPIAVADIQGIIAELSGKGIGILISDHNVRETLGVCHAAYIMNSGEVIEYGDPQHIADSRKAREIYLGDSFRL